MKRATIDIGTNSVRLLFAGDFTGENYKKVEITRLGKGVNETRRLEASRIEATANAVKSFVDEALMNGAKQIDIMATSAARDAENGDDLVNAIHSLTGLKLDIISGDLEAQIGFKGVLSGFPESEELQLVIDIGGGSTELIVGNSKGILHALSIDLGSVRMTGAHLQTDPVSDQDDLNMKKAIGELMQKPLQFIKTLKPQKAIGIGGTCATMITILKSLEVYSREAVHGQSIGLSSVNEIKVMLKAKTIEERKEIIGLEEKRADVIYAGACILFEIMKDLDLPEMIFSDFDNLEGYMAYKMQEK